MVGVAIRIQVLEQVPHCARCEIQVLERMRSLAGLHYSGVFPSTGSRSRAFALKTRSIVLDLLNSERRSAGKFLNAESTTALRVLNDEGHRQGRVLNDEGDRPGGVLNDAGGLGAVLALDVEEHVA